MICCRHATGPLIAPVARDTLNYRFVRQIGLKTLLLWRTVLIISSNLNILIIGILVLILLLYFIVGYIGYVGYMILLLNKTI